MPDVPLPSPHLPRPRLVRRLEDGPIGVLAAPGGFGKSVLGAELRAHLGIASAEIALDRDTGTANEVVGALRRGLRRAGLSDSAATLTGAGDEELRAALDRGPPDLLLVFEEVQHASGAAAEVLAALASEPGPGRRILLIGRRIPDPLGGLGPGVVSLGEEELAFDEGETAELLAAVVGRDATEEEVAAVRRLTFGWPAASALAAATLARGGSLAAGVAGRTPLRALVGELLADVPEEDRDRVARLGHLPLLSPAAAEACSGTRALDLLREAGMPVRAAGDGRYELADPVRDELARLAPLPDAAARAAADVYAADGELPLALDLLGRAGDADGTVRLLAGRRWQELGALDLAELRAILTTLPGEAVAAHPLALVGIARLAEQELDFELSGELLDRATELAAAGPERREAEADAIAIRAMIDPAEGVEEDAEALLESCEGEETRARARALTALGRVGAWRGEPAAALRAERCLREAAALCRLAREPEWEARTLTGLGYRVSFARGDVDAAIEQMADALALLPEPGRERAAVATFLAEAMAFAGRVDDAEATLGEAVAIGRRLGDHRIQAYAAWTGMTAASLRGEGAATLQRARTVELHPGGWFEHPTGIEFLADASLAMARTGSEEAARAFAERASARAEEAGHPEIGWLPAGAVEARWGDPGAAEEALLAFAGSPQQAPRDEWRTLLFRALAAARAERGDAGSLAAQAYERAAELGHPGLPALHEPDVAAVVEPLALAAGSRAASSGEERAFGISLLGGFAVSIGPRPLTPPAGRPSKLVKLLALGDGPMPAAEVVEALWPEVEERTGMQRLRNLLNRLRAECGDLVRREGSSLALANCEVDARAFEEAAVRALEAPEAERPGLARTAMARHTGELLPDDRYEPWAAAPRERVQRRFLELLDLLAEDAVERGAVDEAIRLLDRAQAAQPLDEERYLRAAELLLFQGRRGSARTLVDRAAEVRSQLGLDESGRLARLRAAVGGD